MKITNLSAPSPAAFLAGALVATRAATAIVTNPYGLALEFEPSSLSPIEPWHSAIVVLRRPKLQRRSLSFA